MKNKLLVALGIILSIFVGAMPTIVSSVTEVIPIYIISIFIGFLMAIIFLLQFKINVGINKQMEMEKIAHELFEYAQCFPYETGYFLDTCQYPTSANTLFAAHFVHPNGFAVSPI